MPPPNSVLWYVELKAIEKKQIQEKLSALSRLSKSGWLPSPLYHEGQVNLEKILDSYHLKDGTEKSDITNLGKISPYLSLVSPIYLPSNNLLEAQSPVCLLASLEMYYNC